LLALVSVEIVCVELDVGGSNTLRGKVDDLAKADVKIELETNKLR